MGNKYLNTVYKHKMHRSR